jgi:hypothetical protein
MFPQRADGAPPCRMNFCGLWALGVSGDLPLIAVRVTSTSQMALVRDALRAHEFYRTMGVWCDLVLINAYGNNYEQPVRDFLRDQVAASHLAALVLEPGGAYLLEGAALSVAQRALIEVAVHPCIWTLGALDGALRNQPRRCPTSRSTQGPACGLVFVFGGARSGFNGWALRPRRGYVIDPLAGRPTPAPGAMCSSTPFGFGSPCLERGGASPSPETAAPRD